MTRKAGAFARVRAAEVFRPDTVDLMRDAGQRLAAVPQVKDVYTDRDIEGLGQNLLTETHRWQALQAYRPRWHIEDDAYRELKEGWGLEAQRWGRDAAAARGRVALTCLAFNTAQVYRSRAGQRLARQGIRRLRRAYRREVGAAPAVVYVAGCYAVLAVEELLAALGRPVLESLLPFGGRAAAPERPP